MYVNYKWLMKNFKLLNIDTKYSCYKKHKNSEKLRGYVMMTRVDSRQIL